MKKYLLSIILLIVISQIAYGAKIKDVSQKDPAYLAVKKAVNGSYLALKKDGSFQAQKSVTRKELAISIDKLLREVDTQGLNLNKAEVQELVNLAKKFKGYLVDYESNKKLVNTKLTSVSDEQKVFHNDLSKINSELKADIEKMKKENGDQHLYMIIGIIAAGVIGIAN
jgi:hypothetical protein